MTTPQEGLRSVNLVIYVFINIHLIEMCLSMLAGLSVLDLNLSGHTNTNISLLSANYSNMKENWRISWLKYHAC
jgi:hypothetical protein